MNKKLIMSIACAIIILLFGGVVYMALFDRQEENLREFSLSEYNKYIEKFPYDEILGGIDTQEIAKEKAETVWVEIYGNQIKKEKKPYIVFFDSNNEVWLVTGSLPTDMDGGVPYILIQKSDGKVLAVWHDK